MPALADILLERFDYQADCLPISRPINPLRTQDPFHRIFLTAERISCAQTTPITPCSFYLHCLRELQRLVRQRLPGHAATHFGPHICVRKWLITVDRPAEHRYGLH